jgi:hypothetical protein
MGRVDAESVELYGPVLTASNIHAPRSSRSFNTHWLYVVRSVGQEDSSERRRSSSNVSRVRLRAPGTLVGGADSSPLGGGKDSSSPTLTWRNAIHFVRSFAMVDRCDSTFDQRNPSLSRQERGESRRNDI